MDSGVVLCAVRLVMVSVEFINPDLLAHTHVRIVRIIVVMFVVAMVEHHCRGLPHMVS